MREFKFRAWNKQENEMVDLVSVGSREADKNRSTWPALYYRKSDGIITGFVHEDYEVLQYTGLKDKDGVEIYEGDVLHIDKRFNGVDIYGKVYWKGAGYALITRRGSDTSQGYLEIVTPFTGVVGNIYENPELMVGDENGQTR